MKFEINVYEMENVNSFSFAEIESITSLDEFLYDYERTEINSHCYNFGIDCSKENHLVGLAVGSDNPFIEYPDYNYITKKLGFHFSDFISFLSSLYEESEEIEISIKPVDSKYYRVYVDNSFTDEEAEEADNERFFFSHFENEIDDILLHTYDFREELKEIMDNSNYCHNIFKSGALEKAFKEVKTKAYILEMLKDALENVYEEYRIDI